MKKKTAVDKSTSQAQTSCWQSLVTDVSSFFFFIKKLTDVTWHISNATRRTKEKAYRDAHEFSYCKEDISLVCFIAWKGAAPTGTRKWAGSTTEELPSKRSKQGNILSIYSLNIYTFLCSGTKKSASFKQ